MKGLLSGGKYENYPSAHDLLFQTLSNWSRPHAINSTYTTKHTGDGYPIITIRDGDQDNIMYYSALGIPTCRR